MSLDTQVALARPPRGESTHLSRAARQVVPPFLQKLYEIVNDPANEELIRWSENGDSFYVLNHEKFAREVLGRWFKHQKFASFVRQLNMYGFHKIPHLQQGVLKSDSDTEPWHFEHPNFHRGQPDLLCLIQRKKQPSHPTNEDAPSLDMNDPTSPNGLATMSAGQLTDMNGIVSGITAIKRHQQAISADLSALKQSNDALWKEAVAARQRHAKHQDTINRILKFLAGVFGHTDESGHSSEGSHSPPQVTPRLRQRLMIGASGLSSTATKGRHVDIVEVEDDEADLVRNRSNKTPLADNYATIETIEPIVSSPSAASATEALSPNSEGSPHLPNRSPPTRPSKALSRSTSSNSVPRLSATPAMQSTGAQGASPFGANGQNGNDAMWQSAIQQVMQSPVQFQRFVKAFANHQQSFPGLPPDGVQANHAALSPYDNNVASDYSRWFNHPVASSSTAPMSQSVLAHSDEQAMQVMLDESARLQKSYQDASAIDADMDILQSSIDSLIQNLGIDPGSLGSPSENPLSPPLNGTNESHGTNGMSLNGEFSTAMTPDGYPGVMSNGGHGLGSMGGLGIPGGGQPDFLLDSLLSQIGDGADRFDGGIGGYPDVTDSYDHNAHIDGMSIEDASTEQLTALLDEASSGSASSEATPSTASPIMLPGAVAPISTRPHPPPAKRKSMDVSLPESPEVGMGRKVKRKR